MDVFTPKELGKILDLHPATIRKYIKDGKLTGFKIGGRWRIYKKYLSIFISNGNKKN